jgi:ABC-type polysaccharide/polyol phosphate transport system ATPase subunit
MASVVVENASLSYPIYDISARSIKVAALRSVGGKVNQNHGRVDVQALTEISLQLRDGDRIAIIGRNGAGKTTLLKLIAGIYEPNSGRVRIEGSVSSLTDVTMGMDLDATGSENIKMRGVFLGMTHAEMNAQLQSIEDFTELGPYLSLPVRTYSTGMLVRLGFAVSTACRPEILVMDEMIGAGDFSFAEKAKARIEEYVAESRILVLASHNSAILREFCNRAILIESGRITRFGTVNDVLDLYEKSN